MVCRLKMWHWFGWFPTASVLLKLHSPTLFQFPPVSCLLIADRLSNAGEWGIPFHWLNSLWKIILEEIESAKSSSNNPSSNIMINKTDKVAKDGLAYLAEVPCGIIPILKWLSTIFPDANCGKSFQLHSHFKLVPCVEFWTCNQEWEHYERAVKERRHKMLE